MVPAYAQQPRPKKQQAAPDQQRGGAQAKSQRGAQRRAVDEPETEAHTRAGHDFAVGQQLVSAGNTAAGVLATEAAWNSTSLFDAPFFESQNEHSAAGHLLGLMVAAGRGLVDAFRELLSDRSVWARLQTQDLDSYQLGFRAQAQLVELAAQHVPALLETLGYRPPPQTQEWVDWIQVPIRRLLSGSAGPSAARLAGEAEYNLRLFTIRLNDLVEVSDSIIDWEPDEDEEQSQKRDALFDLRHMVSGALTEGRRRAIAGALATGAGAAVAAAPTGPPGMAAAFVTATGVQAVKSAVEAGALGVLAGRPVTVDTTNPVDNVLTDLAAALECLELAQVMHESAGAVPVVIRRAVLQTLQDAGTLTYPVRQRLWEWAQHMEQIVSAEQMSYADARSSLVDIRQFVEDCRQ